MQNVFLAVGGLLLAAFVVWGSFSIATLGDDLDYVAEQREQCRVKLAEANASLDLSSRAKTAADRREEKLRAQVRSSMTMEGRAQVALSLAETQVNALKSQVEALKAASAAKEVSVAPFPTVVVKVVERRVKPIRKPAVLHPEDPDEFDPLHWLVSAPSR